MDGCISNMKDTDIKQVEAVLSLGRIFTGYKLVILRIGIYLPLLSVFTIIGVIICILLGEMKYDINIIISLLFLNIIAFLIFTVYMFVYYKNKKNLEKLKQFLNDAKKTTAHARRLDIVNPEYKPYQIEVFFEVDGKKYNKKSYPGNAFLGYNKFYNKYCKCKSGFEILYSKEFDEIILLKL